MATHHGNEGVVKVGGVAVAHVQNWSLTVTADVVESHGMGDTWKERLVGHKDWNAQLAVLWDETDAGQGALDEGAAVTLDLYPEGDGAGDTYFSGAGKVTQVGRSASLDGRVEATMSVAGNGALTETTV